ncbi:MULTISPECIES: LysM peptidoglycan-binding domain-containing protein [unclassified Microbacterium]|uniref:LysM peptidoglycan-binding domain-containing protein n=1 Tax=unclassified Microbacterium TaxID=2609290 RepID=UPI00214A9E68|nr:MULTISPECIES: LysM peptidoglycan-binding domain-containing protein [unclassified Microbacterium]MCR2785994.1 LysM peptidoglycan-binding domain-containing protein [Microbacterium sp. zg.B96]WIM16972.1 LysM peptidoglycan-binding domain-containing protein [Microbacterium sp. zg-B96]
MTTIEIAGTAPSTTRLRITPRGRRVLAGIAALPAVAALGFGILSGGGALATMDAPAPAGTFETVTVTAGESLWGIAEEVAPQADPRDVIDAIVRLNALESSNLAAGQRLSIPLEYVAGH